ncbi:hypothetical protein WS70_19960 [Burkholderia mayonis]|uniref:Uncharacterized protein n=1 Tax=Burkholderia mayonis TaxID=1385591 RepID=A0A1B4FKH3_9BURK|nr:hypothetical protein WS70_19960 [Burkholderia mayonis]
MQQLLACLGEPLRHSLVAAQPRQLLQSRAAAVFAPDPTARDMQHDSVLEQRQIAHSPNRRLVDLLAARSALFAVHDFADRLQI